MNLEENLKRDSQNQLSLFYTLRIAKDCGNTDYYFHETEKKSLKNNRNRQIHHRKV